MSHTRVKGPDVLNRLYHVNICVSDLDRAIDFYTDVAPVTETERRTITGESLVPHLGVTVTTLRVGVLRFSRPRAPLIDLVEFVEPVATNAPYADLRNLGIARVSFWTADFEHALSALKQANVELVGPDVRYVSPLGTPLRTVMFRDPDGTTLQYIGADS